MATITVSTDTNYSALTVANNDLIALTSGAVLTIEQTTARILRLEASTLGKILLQNSSTTTPIFLNIGDTGGTPRIRVEQAGEFVIRGEWITLGTISGAAGQTFSLPTDAGGANYDLLGGAWVFPDGGGAPMRYMRVDSFTNTFGVEHIGNVFTHDATANTITFGDNTNGHIPPKAAEVRIPNIQIKDSNQGANISLTDFNATGQADWDKVLLGDGWNFSTASAASIKFSYVGISSPLNSYANMQTMVGPATIDSTIFSGSYVRLNNGSGLVCNGMSVFDDRTGNDNSVSYQNNTSGTINDLTVVAPNRSGSSSRASLNCISSNVTIDTLYSASKNNMLYFSSGASNCTASNLYGCAIGKRGDSGVSNVSMVRINANLSNTIVQNVNTYPSLAEGASPFFYGAIVGISTEGCVIDGMTLDADSYTRSAILAIGGENNRVNDVTVRGRLLGGPIDHQTASIGLKVSNLFYEDSQGATVNNVEFATKCLYDYISIPNGYTVAANGTGSDCTSHTFYRTDGSRADGALVLKMIPDLDSGYLTIINQTGFITFDNNGRLYMANSGDVIELETRVHGGITGFTSATKNGNSGGSSWDVRFKIRTASGTYGAYQDFTLANLQAAFTGLASYDSNEGLQIKYELTKNNNSKTAYMQFLICNTTVDPAYRVPFVLNEVDLTLTNLIPGSDIVILDAGTDVRRVDVDANPSTTYTYTYEFSIGDVVDIGVFKTGYRPEYIRNFTLGSTDASIPISQKQDLYYLE